MSNSPTIAPVTGATCGIGLETVRQLARTGAIVFLAGRDSERTRVAARSLSAAVASRNAAPLPFHRRPI
jgi:NAD(P)-dependent dehydrogenase (short-subunit alcohol dehydrogenase family)